MGCGSSTEVSSNGHAGNGSYPRQAQPQQPEAQHKPVANVPPQQQATDSIVASNERIQENHAQKENPRTVQNNQENLKNRQEKVSRSEERIEEEEKTDIKVSHVDLTKEVIERYIALEKKIASYGEKNTLKVRKEKEAQLEDLGETIKQLEDHYKKCVQDMEKEKADVDNVKSFFKTQENYEALLAKEQKEQQDEYLEAFNRQEVAEKELEGVKQQREALAKEIATLKTQSQELDELVQESEEILASVFNGTYGSAEENRLELELEQLKDKKNRITAAKGRWQHGRLLLSHAVHQLSVGVAKWDLVVRIPENNMPQRYQVATEARNNFIAASQNITSTQRYLTSIVFPYCKPDEVATLNKAVEHIYTDMQSSQRHSHAMNCYSVTHKRCSALLQWFDFVIQKTIEKDYAEVKKDYEKTEVGLRQERLNLLKAKIVEEKGENADISGINFEAGAVKKQDEEEQEELKDVVMVGGESGGDAPAEDTQGGTSSVTPLPLDELAPPPSDDDLFGNINDLKKQHEKEMEDFQKAQEMNKIRMEKGLEEKLKARKSRRAAAEAVNGPES